jgi:hypothetical protein
MNPIIFWLVIYSIAVTGVAGWALGKLAGARR